MRKEDCGNPERHEYELYLDIDNRAPRPKSPPDNGICERSIERESMDVSRVAFRKKNLSNHRRDAE